MSGFLSSLDGDIESSLGCCYCQLVLCHTHPLPLFLRADSSSKQSLTRVVKYQFRKIIHISKPENLNIACFTSYSLKQKRTDALYFSTPSVKSPTVTRFTERPPEFKWHSFPSADAETSQAARLLMAAELKSSLNQSDWYHSVFLCFTV